MMKLRPAFSWLFAASFATMAAGLVTQCAPAVCAGYVGVLVSCVALRLNSA